MTDHDWKEEVDSIIYEIDSVSPYPKIMANAQYVKGNAMTDRDQLEMVINVAAEEFIQRYIGSEIIPSSNPYEMACTEFEMINTAIPILTKIADRISERANDKWNAAQAKLRTFERAPGIAKDEYRIHPITSGQPDPLTEAMENFPPRDYIA